MTPRRTPGEPARATSGAGAGPLYRPALSPSVGTGSEGLRFGYFGVEGLDDLVPSGITYDTQIMVEGDTGIGKSVLAAQFLYEGLVTGDTCIYIACDEPRDVMRANRASLRFGTAAHERIGLLIFVDA